MNTSKLLESVIDDLKLREQKGIETYNTTMDRKDLSHHEWLQHLYEELLDASLYTKKLIKRFDKLKFNLKEEKAKDLQ
jgi:hypothetical protein